MIYNDMFEPVPAAIETNAAQPEPKIEPIQTEPEPPAPEPEPDPLPPEPPELVDPDFGVNMPDPDQFPTPEVMPMRQRNEKHKPFNDVQKAFWRKYVERNPASFDALLYRVVPVDDEPPAPEGYEQPEFESVDIRQTEPIYLDPLPVVVLDSPIENEAFTNMDSGGENAVDDGSIMVLQIAADGDVPNGSVLEWVEATADGKGRRVWWYIHRSMNLGTTTVGTLYYCIPCRTFEGVITRA